MFRGFAWPVRDTAERVFRIAKGLRDNFSGLNHDGTVQLLG
jgi:hypothetical protein